MTVLVDKKYGEAMIKRQKLVLPELRARRQMLDQDRSVSISRLALCALDMVIRRHEARLRQNE